MQDRSPPRFGLDLWLSNPAAQWQGWYSLAARSACTHDGRSFATALATAGRPMPRLLDAGPQLSSPTALRDQLRSAIEVHRPTGILVDLPDLGLRSTPENALLTALLRAASSTGIQITVLDRPNPLDGESLEGPLVHPGFETCQASDGLPLRHGLTVAEHARHRVRDERLDVHLQVVRCSGWRRDMNHEDTDLPVASGTPPAPWVRAVGLVPGATDWVTLQHADALVFGEPWSEEMSLLEFVEKGAADADTLGATFESIRFTPNTGPHAGTPCRGVKVQSPMPRTLDTLKVGLVLAEAALRVHTVSGCPPPFPKTGTGHPLDHLLGSPEGRLGLAAHVRTTELLGAWATDLEQFADSRRASLLY